MEFAILALVVILVDLAALRWGADSRDGLNNSEWSRRQLANRAF